MILHLVRHPPVAKHWQARCYGQSDPGLSRAGQTMVGPLVAQLAALKPDVIIHSDRIRTRAIAVPLARRVGIASIAEPLWQERNFGSWEGLSWARIYRETGNAMDGMLTAPDTFCPGGGETTSALIRRIERALAQLPRVARAIVIAHGGSIAGARMLLGGAGIDKSPNLIPGTGEIVSIPFD